MEMSLSSIVKLPDLLFARFYLRFFREKNALVIFTFHLLFRNEEESTLNHVNPQLGITTDHFCQFVEYYLSHGYSFISPNDILNGLDHHQSYIMITFDDGYFNNIHALPFLKKYKIPAVFFISTNNIIDNKCFWWDVLYRERMRLGASAREIKREEDRLKTRTNEEIESYLVGKFGEKAFRPISDIDRPFTTAELKNLSNEKYVSIGNHTSDHAILTNYDLTGIRSQILCAQDFIYNNTKTSPIIISYPDGFYSDEVIKVAKETGFGMGVTTDFKKNYLPINNLADDCMRLGRFDLGGSEEPLQLCELFRSDKIFYKWIWNFLNKRYFK